MIILCYDPWDERNIYLHLPLIINQMWVNIPYMDCLGYYAKLICFSIGSSISQSRMILNYSIVLWVRNLMQDAVVTTRMTLIIYKYSIYLQPVCPLLWGFNPPKEGPFQSKQGSFGFQVYIHNFGLGVQT